VWCPNLNRLVLLFLVLALGACTASTPRDINNICSIFREKDDWYDEAAEAQEEWGSSIPTMMAIIYQESKFQADAKPPRKKILGIIPWFRPSNSYGYSQAKTGTWEDYERSAGRFGADRDDFADSVDFVGWYNYQSKKRSGISLQNTYGLYLAYHEGHGGYNRATYRQKQWLIGVARKVEARAGTYRAQLVACEEELENSGGLFGWF
jgi:hypothetical protein